MAWHLTSDTLCLSVVLSWVTSLGLVFGILSTLAASKEYPNHCHQGVEEKLAWAEDQWL